MELNSDKYFSKKKELVENRLKELFQPCSNPIQNKLIEAASYALDPKAKRLRPLLFLATVDTFNIDSSIALDIACAIELIHTYSLIHDDLPCMDDDDLRRNKPTLHKAFSESTALLTGDMLLTYAFEIIAKTKGISETKKNSIITTLATNAGFNGMITGQFLDLYYEGKEIDFETLKYIHNCKTASLIVAVLHCGGIISDANEKELSALINFGKHIGLSYQIVDDILDTTSTEDQLGKPINSDKKKKKATAISILGLKQAEEMAKKYFESGILFLSGLSYPPPLLKHLAHKFIKRKS